MVKANFAPLHTQLLARLSTFKSFLSFFWCGTILNSFVFASLAVVLVMIVRAYADQSMLSNFFITPMAFLGTDQVCKPAKKT